MGTRTARAMRGFAAHDARVSIDTLTAIGDPSVTKSASSYSQAGPSPGSAVPSLARSFILPHAHGAQGQDLELQLVRGGEPGSDTGAGWIYREADSTDTDEYRGWNEFNLFQRYVPAEFHTAGTESWFDAHAVTIPSSQQVVVVCADEDATAREDVSSWTWDPATRTWGARVEVGSDATAIELCCCWIHEDTERIGVLRTNPASRLGSTWYSDDAGATWSLINERVFDGGASTFGNSNTDQLTACVDRLGNVLVVTWDSSGGNWHAYRSEDRGATFTESGTGTSNMGARPKLLRRKDGRLLLFYLHTSTGYPTVQVLDDAFDLPSSATVTVGATDCRNLAAWEDDDGVLYVAAQDDGALTVHQGYLWRSLDSGTTWSQYTVGPWTHSTGGANYVFAPRDAAVTGGSVLLFGQQVAGLTAPLATGTLTCFELGGWSTIEHGPWNGVTGDLSRLRRESFGYDTGGNLDSYMFVPHSRLNNQGWTLIGTAATLDASGRWRWAPAAATAGASLAWTYTGNVPHTYEFRDFEVESGGSTSANECAIEIRHADGSLEFMLVIRGDDAGNLVIRDEHGASNTLVSVDLTTPIDLKVCFSTVALARVYWKRRASDVWIEVFDGALTDKGGSYSANSQVRVGCLATTTSVMYLSSVAWVADGDVVHVGTSSSSTYQRLMYGKALNTYPYGVRDQGDSARRLRLSADGGPGVKGETFELPAIYAHGVDRTMPQVSRRRVDTWRSTDKSEQILTWELGAANTLLDGGLYYALALERINFRTAYLEVLDNPGTGSWTTIGTLDAATGFTTMNFARSGDIVSPASSGVGGRFLQDGELVDGYVVLDPSGTPSAHRIEANTGGLWNGNSTITAKLRLATSGVTGGTPTSGALHLVAPRALLVVPQALSGASHRWIRLRIPASQDTPDDYYEIGQIVLGSIVVLGRQWSRGWSLRYEPIVDEDEDEYGTVYVDERGPLRRELTAAWTDGLDLTELRQSDDVDYLGAASMEPQAAENDVWWRAAGLYRLLQSGELPAVAVMAVPETATTITDPTQWFIGALTGRLQVNHVVGDEGASELVRVESLTLREIR